MLIKKRTLLFLVPGHTRKQEKLHASKHRRIKYQIAYTPSMLYLVPLQKTGSTQLS
jgi:hypothetical protein